MQERSKWIALCAEHTRVSLAKTCVKGGGERRTSDHRYLPSSGHTTSGPLWLTKEDTLAGSATDVAATQLAHPCTVRLVMGMVEHRATTAHREVSDGPE